jgi:hypothetical protein
VATPDSIKFAASDSAVYESKTNPQFKSVNFFIAKNVTPKQKVAFAISGKGEMPREQEQASNTNGRRGEPSGPGGGMGVPNERPDPLHSGQWLFLGVLSLFLAAGGVFVYTSNQNVPATAGAAVPQDRSTLLMEAMKEEVFQLESDRLQGKINPQDYQTAKAALDKTLQRAVQRQSKAT